MKMTAVLFSCILAALALSGCTSVSDNVATVVDAEQYRQLNQMFDYILQFKADGDNRSLEKAIGELESIDMNQIYNKDYKAKILGMKSLARFYQGDRVLAVKYLKDLESVSKDEEFYWIVSALMEKDKKTKLHMLLKGKESVYSVDKLNIFLADAYMENEKYGEAAALYDTILQGESNFQSYFQNLRDIAYMFMKNPPASYETGMLLVKDQIDMETLIDAVYKETDFLSSYNRDNIWSVLKDRRYFADPDITPRFPLLRKDLACFLFALIADRNNDSDMWKEYDSRYNPDLSDEMKKQMEDLSPIGDTPAYKYYFYPAVYLVEQEIMELPDGENFFPNNLVSGAQLFEILGNLKSHLH